MLEKEVRLNFSGTKRKEINQRVKQSDVERRVDARKAKESNLEKKSVSDVRVERRKVVESKVDDVESDVDEIIIAGVRAENRNFLAIKIEDETHKGLLDPGATLSLIGPGLAAKFREKLRECSTLVRTVTGRVSKHWGYSR